VAVFLSYRRGLTTDIVARIDDRLQRHFGSRFVFRDLSQLALGQDFHRQLYAALNQATVLLAIIGPDWVERKREPGALDYAASEIAVAFERRIPVVPVLVLGAALPRADQLPPNLVALLNHQCTRVSSDEGFEDDMARLVRGIERYVPRPQTAAPTHQQMSRSARRHPVWLVAALTATLGLIGIALNVRSHTDSANQPTVTTAPPPVIAQGSPRSSSCSSACTNLDKQCNARCASLAQAAERDQCLQDCLRESLRCSFGCAKQQP